MLIFGQNKIIKHDAITRKRLKTTDKSETAKHSLVISQMWLNPYKFKNLKILISFINEYKYPP